jgi:hypothetical protein
MVPNSGYQPPAIRPPTNTMAQVGGIVAIAGWVLAWIPVFGIPIGFLMGVLAIIFSAIGLGKLTEYSDDGKGMATAGLVIGIATVIWKLIPGLNLI